MQPKHSMVLVWMISITMVWTSTRHIAGSQQATDYRRVRRKRYHESSLSVLSTCIFEAIKERKLGVTGVLSNSNVHQQWLAQTRHNWLPACPIYDVSSQATNSFLGARSLVDTLSTSLPFDSAMNINSDLVDVDSLQIVNISSHILQSPNINPSSSMDLSNALI